MIFYIDLMKLHHPTQLGSMGHNIAFTSAVSLLRVRRKTIGIPGELLWDKIWLRLLGTSQNLLSYLSDSHLDGVVKGGE